MGCNSSKAAAPPGSQSPRDRPAGSADGAVIKADAAPGAGGAVCAPGDVASALAVAVDKAGSGNSLATSAVVTGGGGGAAGAGDGGGADATVVLPPGHTFFTWLGGAASSVPLGHTEFSWRGGVVSCVPPASVTRASPPSAATAAACKGGDVAALSAGPSGGSGTATGAGAGAGDRVAAAGDASLALSALEVRLTAVTTIARSVRCFAVADGEDWRVDTTTQESAADGACREMVVRDYLLRGGVLGAVMLRVPSNYYSRPLEQRAKLLKCGVQHLCKCIVVQNQLFDASACGDWRSSRFVCVVLQYTAKLDMEKLADGVRVYCEPKLAKQQCKFTVAAAQDSDRVTGYTHNAVTPFALATPVPVVVSAEVAALKPPFLWLGGGHVDVKLRIPVPQLLTHVDAKVVQCTTPRGVDDDEE